MTTTASIADIRVHRLDDASAWTPDAHTPEIRICDMSQEFRLHLAASLIDGASMQAAAYRLYFDRIVGRPCPPIGNPLAWMKDRPLFRALVKGLPNKRNVLGPIAERTRHEAFCSGGACACDLTPAISPATLAIVGDAARLAKSVTA